MDVVSGTVEDRPPTVIDRLGDWLGTQELRSDRDVLQMVEQRLPTETIVALTAHGLTEPEVYRLVIPRRTLSHRRAKRQSLSQEESDRAVRLARIVALAEGVFGDRAKALHWLRKPNHRFEGRTPLGLVVTEAGARLVEELLYQIDHGIFA